MRTRSSRKARTKPAPRCDASCARSLLFSDQAEPDSPRVLHSTQRVSSSSFDKPLFRRRELSATDNRDARATLGASLALPLSRMFHAWIAGVLTPLPYNAAIGPFRVGRPVRRATEAHECRDGASDGAPSTCSAHA